MNVAVTVFATSIVTVHVVGLGVVRQPVNPPKVEPPAGVAVSVTVESFVKSRTHAAPHRSPAGALVTSPPPFPPW